MAGRDPKYGATSAGFSDALARTAAQLAEIDKTTTKLTASEAANTRGVVANTGARTEQLGVLGQQARALEALGAALTTETSLLRANSAAWAQNAAVRQGAAVEGGAATGATATTKGARYGGSTASIAPVEVTAAQTAALRDLEAQMARLESRAAGIAATPLAIQQRSLERFQRGPLALPETTSAGDPIRASRWTFQGASEAMDGGLSQRRAEAEYERRLAAVQRPTGPGLPFLAGPVGAGGSTYASATRTPSYAPFDRTETASVGEFTAAEQHAGQVAEGLNSRLAQQAVIQADVNAAFGQSVGIYAQADSALTRHGALSTEFISALSRGEVTMRDFGTVMTQTIGKFGGWAVAGGLVYGAYDALKKFGEGAISTQSGVAQLERSLPGVNRGEAASGFRKLSREVNVPISEAATAQFYAARAFPTQQGSEEVARTALLASKLDEVNPQDAIKTFAALNVQFGEGPKAIQKTFDELDVGQLKFNARLQQTLPAIGRAASSFAAAGGKPQELNEQITELYKATGGGGGTGGGNPATFLIREPANLRRSEAQQILREFDFKPEEAYTNVGRFNREVQQLAPSLSNPELQALAKAAGGGSALGLRYALPLFRAGQTTLPEEVHAHFSNAADESQKDLEHKLGQVNEQLKKIGVTFESVGSQIGEGGLITAVQAIANVVQFAARQVGAALGPFEQLGSLFQGLGHVEQTTGLALGGAALLTRFARSNSGLATRGLAANAVGGRVGGLLYSDDAGSLRNLRAQNSSLLRELATEQGSAGRQVFRTAFASRRAGAALEADRQQNPYLYSLAPEDRVEYGKTKEGQAAVARAVALEREQEVTLDANKAAIAHAEAIESDTKAATEGQRILAGGADPTGKKARYNALFGGNVAVAQRSIGSNIEPLEAATAEGAAASAKATGQATVAVRRYGTSVAEDIQATRAATVDAQTQIAASATESVASPADSATHSGILAAAKGKFADYNSRLFGALNAAFITSIGANIVGETIGGKLGKKIEGVGSTAGLGAAAGFYFGGLPGAAVGGVAGALASPYPSKAGKGISPLEGIGYKTGELFEATGIPQFASNLLYGNSSYTPYAERREKEREITAAEKAKEEAQLAEHQKAVRTRVAKRFPHLGLKESRASVERQELEYLGEEGGEEFEEAGQTGGRGEEARKKLTEQVGRLDALAKLQQGSPAGERALAELQRRIGAGIGSFASHPEEAALYAQTINTALTDTTGSIQERFKNELATASTPAQREAILGRGATRISQAQTNIISAPKQVAEQRLANDRYERQKLEQQAAAPGISDSDRAALQKRIQGFVAGIEKMQGVVAVYNSSLPAVKAALANLGKELDRAVVESNVQQINVRTGLQVARAGNNPAAKRAEEEHGAEQALKQYEQGVKRGLITPGEGREKRREVETQQASRQEGREKEGLERVRAEAQVAESRTAPGEPLALAQVHAREAARISAAAQTNRSISPVERLGLQASANDAARSLAEAQQQRAVQEVQVEGQITAASKPGNAVAQAQAAQATASKLAALAQNPLEALQAQLLAVQAGNQLHEALQGRIKLEGEYADSLTLDPIARDRKDIKTAKRVLSKAVGPEDKLKAKTDLNNTVNKYHEDLANVADEEIAFQLHTNRITEGQAVERWQKLLAQGHISAQRRRDIQTKIYDAETANNRDFAVGSIRQAPTLYDALTLSRRAPARSPGSSGVSFQAIHHPPQLTQHNTIHINVTGDKGQFAGEMERVFGTLTRSQLRSAGLS